MGITRREFLQNSASASVSMAGVGGLAGRTVAPATSQPDPRVVPMPAGEWMAPSPGSADRAYRSKDAKTADASTWVQIDLGKRRTIDSIKLYPANDRFHPGEGFPIRFKIEGAEEPEFQQAVLLVDQLGSDVANPRGNVQQYPARGAACRYVRLTATRLMNIESHAEFEMWGGYRLAVGKMEIHSEGRDVAESCPVTVDKAFGNDADGPQVTRPPRPGGENTSMDHPENVTDPTTWNPPLRQVKVPRTGVTLQGGIFQKAMEQNVEYLLSSYSVDELLRQFRERTGTVPPFQPPTNGVKFWEEDWRAQMPDVS